MVKICNLNYIGLFKMSDRIYAAGATTITPLFPLTKTRIKSVQNHVTSCTSGKQSLDKALKDSKKEGPIALIKQYINKIDRSQKDNTIEEAFMFELYKHKLNAASTELDELLKSFNDSTQNPTLTNETRAKLWGLFSRLNINTSKISSTALLSHDKNGNIKLTINFPINRNQEAKSFEYKNNLSTERILLEYNLFKKWHQNVDIPRYDDEYKHLSFGTHTKVVDDFENNILPKRDLDSLTLPSGGAKGVFIPGCMLALGKHALKNIKSVAGSSVGSMVASTIACGATPHEIEESAAGLRTLDIIASKKQRDLNHKDLIQTINRKNIAIIKKRISENQIPKNDEVNSLIDSLNNEENYQITFGDLSILKNQFKNAGFKDLHIPITIKPENIEFELSAKTVPHMPIAIAIQASSALPHVFSHVNLTEYLNTDTAKQILTYKKISRNLEENIWASDGGVVNAVPISHTFNCDQNSPKFLALNFNNISDKSLSLKEKLKQRITSSSAYTDKRVIIKFLTIFFPKSLQFIRLPKYDIGTTDFKIAAEQFHQITENQQKEFIQSYLFPPDTTKAQQLELVKFPGADIMKKLKNIESQYHQSRSMKQLLNTKVPDDLNNISNLRDKLYYLAGTNEEAFNNEYAKLNIACKSLD